MLAWREREPRPFSLAATKWAGDNAEVFQGGPEALMKLVDALPRAEPQVCSASDFGSSKAVGDPSDQSALLVQKAYFEVKSSISRACRSVRWQGRVRPGALLQFAALAERAQTNRIKVCMSACAWSPI